MSPTFWSFNKNSYYNEWGLSDLKREFPRACIQYTPDCISSHSSLGFSVQARRHTGRLLEALHLHLRLCDDIVGCVRLKAMTNDSLARKQHAHFVRLFLDLHIFEVQL